MTKKKNILKQCGEKRPFDSLNEARDMALNIEDRTGEEMKAYKCPYCDWYHLGHSKPER